VVKVDELTKIPKVLGAGLATDDGFIIESQFTVGYDAEKSAAMAAQVVNRIKNSLNVEKSSIILYTQNNVFFVKETEGGIFFVICQRDANIGLVKVKIDKIK
jgi:predicted regulator of Ras-like GTPase activity (Roadblock/LC7/MglB family)